MTGPIKCEHEECYAVAVHALDVSADYDLPPWTEVDFVCDACARSEWHRGRETRPI